MDSNNSVAMMNTRQKNVRNTETNVTTLRYMSSSNFKGDLTDRGKASAT